MKQFFQSLALIPFIVILPLAWRSDLLLTWPVIAIIIAGIIFNITSPYTAPRELKDEKDTYSTLVLFVANYVLVVACLVDFAYLNPTSGNGVMTFTGYGLLGVALLFRFWVIQTLGKYFTMTIVLHEEHTVVAHGPYRYLRHPAYLGSLLIMLSIPMIFQSWWGFAAYVAFVIPSYSYRISVEEVALVRKLGADYVERQKATWRIVPFLY